MRKGFPVDDFGNEVMLVSEMSINAMNQCIRFFYDGIADAIADGTLSGTSTEDSLRFTA